MPNNERRMRIVSIIPILLPLLTFAQPDLLPSIGIGALPADNEPICTLPFQTPPIQNVGRPEGEQAADFTLYDHDGIAFNLESALLLGKPVLMISSSYTCPVFRNKVPLINDVVATYGSQLTTIIVYTPEAHPIVDASPYFGAVNTGQANIQAGILYEQPDTYGERKAILQDMLNAMQIDAPVYLDGPCNNWWNHYGPQPNNAYLINTDGTIFRHHDWLDRTPDDIHCDIDSLLGLPTDCDQSFGGSFSVQLAGNDTIWGDAASTITGHAILTNATNVDCLVRVVKLQVAMPADWASSLCADVCYLPDVDTALVLLPANTTMDFYYYFYTATAGVGFTRVGFRNESNTSNSFLLNYWAVASDANGIEQVAPSNTWGIAPNPAQGSVTITGGPGVDGLLLTDLQGREVARYSGRAVDVSMLSPGVYLARPLQQGRIAGTAFTLIKE